MNKKQKKKLAKVAKRLWKIKHKLDDLHREARGGDPDAALEWLENASNEVHGVALRLEEEI
jgi:hypothetical protein